MITTSPITTTNPIAGGTAETISAEEQQHRQYAVITESVAHRETKLRIAAVLASTYGAEAVRVERRVDTEAPAEGWMTWRKPDVLVSVTIAGRPVRIAVEVQLCNTHVGVVVDRHDFYLAEVDGKYEAIDVPCEIGKWKLQWYGIKPM